MNAASLYAFYGSLRRGMQYHRIHRVALEYRFSVRLKGYTMYALQEYPFAVRDECNNSIVAEVFHVKDAKTERSIHELELDAGYFYEEVKIQEMKVGIYLFRRAENYPEVVGGDWVKFFGFR